MGLKVLSLFDGMSCGQIALRELGMEVDRYYSSEVDRHCTAQTRLNFPDTMELGDVRSVDGTALPKIDLVLAGSPCQGFSMAGKMLNFDDPRSGLFFEFCRVLGEVRKKNPDVKFLLENVRMKREYMERINEIMGLRPVAINSALVSAQNRVRLYWTNILTDESGTQTAIPQPEDRGLVLRDILESDPDERYYMKAQTMERLKASKARREAAGCGFGLSTRGPEEKSNTVTVGGQERVRHSETEPEGRRAATPGQSLVPNGRRPRRRQPQRHGRAGDKQRGGHHIPQAHTHGVRPVADHTGVVQVGMLGHTAIQDVGERLDGGGDKAYTVIPETIKRKIKKQ